MQICRYYLTVMALPSPDLSDERAKTTSRHREQQQLATVKVFQTEQHRLEVAGCLASNPDLVISSSSNDDVNAMMMCDAVLTKVQPGQPINRSQVCTNRVSGGAQP